MASGESSEQPLEIPNPDNWEIPEKENYDPVDVKTDRENNYLRVIWKLRFFGSKESG